MAQKLPPMVNHALLDQPGAEAIVVGSPAWYTWLTDATSFSFTSPHGTFTAQKERRGPTREYWKAYRRRSGRLYRAYLGKSEELTLERLNLIAAELAGDAAAVVAPSDGQALRQRDVQPDTAAAPPQPPPERSSSSHLVSTKLTIPPARPALVRRPRLIEQLNTALSQGQRLSLISAPPGFGKTTLLVEWLATQAHDIQVAWISLDERDNHLSQFLAYLIAAVERVQPASATEAWALLRAGVEHPPAQAIVTTLVNLLAAAPGQRVLIFDDYHVITDQAIHEAIAILLDRIPAQMHVMITTRADPPLPLARLRVRGMLAEVRAAELRFSHAETSDFFDRLYKVQLPPAALTMLETRTEGWAAGLQLAALSLQQQDAADYAAFLASFSGSHTYVFDYLVDEVFQRQPEDLRTFLAQTAVLPRMCGPLCAAVTGREDAQQVLDTIEQANLFLIGLDRHRRWYRYHPLFREVLLAWLDRTLGTAARAQLYRRASVWFEQQGLAGEAIDHALSAKAWDDALRCIQPLMAAEQMYDYFLHWPRWVAAFPTTVLVAHPEQSLRLGWILMFTGHVEAAKPILDLVEARWQAEGNQQKVGEVLGWRSAAYYWQRDFRRTLQAAQAALERLPADAPTLRALPTLTLGLSYYELGQTDLALSPLRTAHATFQHTGEFFFELGALHGMARTHQLQGQLQQAAALYQAVIQRSGDSPYHQGPSYYNYFGTLVYEWNDLERAEALLREGIAVGQRTGRGRYWPSSLSMLARVLWARGQADEASSTLAQALTAAHALETTRDIAEAEIHQVWFWLAQDDLPSALRWMTTRTPIEDGDIPYDREAECRMIARIQLAHAWAAPGTLALEPIIQRLERLAQLAEAQLRLGDRIQSLILQALAYAACGERSDAQDRLKVVLELAAPGRYIRSFVDDGPQLHRLLTQLQADSAALSPELRAYLEYILAAFGSAVAGSPPPARPLLSSREQAVLTLLAEGRTVEEIAQQFVISIHTARSHVKNIYVKLEAHNRVQALERARALQLL